MKRALILHGTDASSQDNWFPWLFEQLKARGLEVWVPDLPGSNKPNIARYNEFLLQGGLVFDEDTLLIGHSSGAVALLGLLEELPYPVGAAVCVSAFTHDLGWESLTDLFVKPFDFENLQTKAEKYLFVHAKDDPYCPVDQAKDLATKLHGEFVLLDSGGHFSASLDPQYTAFPALLALLDERKLV
ncbi:MAG TPA: alpha/beta fold hydrolase [Candidatus Saccharimonadales bacterium]|nr:alpha/beta fold hydrolase [Candidatus Saccharimonadales bacterium]